MVYQAYNFGHDAWDYSTNVLQKHTEAHDKSLRFRSPYRFGPSPGPRRPLNLSTDLNQLRGKLQERSTTYTVRFKTSRTYVQNLLPPGFAFTSPATLVSASIICSTLEGMAWLSGGGYSHAGLYLHGVNYTKRDGSKIFGTYIPVLFENLADPIITGRDEVGFPKLFADINVAQEEPADVKITLGWRGTTFGSIHLKGLSKTESVINGMEESHPPPKRGPGPPPPPPEAGQFVYRWVPAVGEPGKADAEYPVFCPYPKLDTEQPSERAVAESASIRFEAGDWQSLPTLHNVTNILAQVPIYKVEKAELSKGPVVDDLSRAHRIE